MSEVPMPRPPPCAIPEGTRLGRYAVFFFSSLLPPIEDPKQVDDDSTKL